MKDQRTKEYRAAMKHITTIIAVLTLCLITTGAALANQLHPVSGAYYTSEVDLKVASRGIPMAWERTYRSNRTILTIKDQDTKYYDYASPIDGPLGFGWHTPFTMRIWKNAPLVSDPQYLCDALIDADGRVIYFEKGPGGIVLPDYQNGYTLSSTTTGYLLTQRGGNSWNFDLNGRLSSITDPLGRTATLVYSGEQLTAITDAANRTVFTLTWDNGHISRVTDLAGWAITYSYDGGGNLTGISHIDPVTSAPETLFTYVYNSVHGLTGNRNAEIETWTVK